MRGYPPWPAKVLGFTKNGQKIKCSFYGSHNTGSVGIDQAIPFLESFECIRLIKIRNPREFIKGVREIEIEQGIPNIASSLRDYESIE